MSQTLWFLTNPRMPKTLYESSDRLLGAPAPRTRPSRCKTRDGVPSATRSLTTPLLADLDTSPGLELAALGRFAVSQRYLAEPESLVTAARTEIAVWRLPVAGAVAWGEWGGGPGHAFFDGLSRPVQSAPNDVALSSFAVGPNPAGAEARARVTLTAAARVRCRLFTLEGEAVRESEREGAPGTIVEIPIDLRGLASGTYLVQLELSTGGRRVRPLAVGR